MTAQRPLTLLVALTVTLAVFICVGCRRKVVDIPIATQPCVIDTAGVEFTLTQPLKRHFNSASVLIGLADSWEPEPPWTGIRLSDGRLARVSVQLRSDDGRVFSSALLGAVAGDEFSLNARFQPEVPRDAAIRVISISSTIPLRCLKVTWHDLAAL